MLKAKALAAMATRGMCRADIRLEKFLHVFASRNLQLLVEKLRRLRPDRRTEGVPRSLALTCTDLVQTACWAFSGVKAAELVCRHMANCSELLRSDDSALAIQPSRGEGEDCEVSDAHGLAKRALAVSFDFARRDLIRK